MKINLSTKELLTTLQKVISIVEKKHSLPILSHVLITTNDNKLTLTTTDSEIQIQAQIQIKSPETSDFTLYAKNLIDIIKNIQLEENISFDISSEKIIIKINKNKFKLNTFNHSDFPLLQKIKKYQTITVNIEKLKDLIDKTSFTIGNQDIRAYLNGLYFEANETELTIVATDGHRLSIGSIEQLNNQIEPKTIILPKKAVNEITKLLSNQTTEKNIDINISDNYLQISLNDISINSQLINSKFPDYNKAIPTNIDNKITINKDDLINNLKSVLPLIDDRKRSVKLEFKDNDINIYAQSEKGYAEAKLTVENNNNNLEVVFNINYLIAVLEKLTTTNINIAIPNNINQSYLFTNNNNSNYQYIIMPMKI